MTDYRPRELAASVEEALESLPVVVVTGPRQSGKTTFLQRDPIFRRRRYVTFDDFAVLEGAKGDPQALLRGDDPLTIDEAQRFPEILVEIKRAVDRHRKPGQYILSGSANFALLRGVSESLAGRAVYRTLRPFTRREKDGRTSEVPFLVRFLRSPALPKAKIGDAIRAEEVLDGGMPSVVLREAKKRDLWFQGYTQTYLERDLRALSQVADLGAFRLFLRLAAHRTGQVLNESALARDAKISHATSQRYLSLLETSYLAERLRPFLRSRNARLVKASKLYVADSGLAAHLANITDLDSLADDPMRGALFETYVVQNILGILEAHAPGADWGFWNIQGRHEVDLVVQLAGTIAGIEIKSSARFDDGDLRGLRAFMRSEPKAKCGILAYNGSEAVSLGEGLYAVPLAALLM